MFKVNIKDTRMTPVSPGGWTSYFQKGGGLAGPQFLDGVVGKKGVTFFRGWGAVFTQKYTKIWNI